MVVRAPELRRRLARRFLSGAGALFPCSLLTCARILMPGKTAGRADEPATIGFEQLDLRANGAPYGDLRTLLACPTRRTDAVPAGGRTLGTTAGSRSLGDAHGPLWPESITHRSMSQSYDAVVIGSGHNALITAAYLSRAGWSVIVLEQNDRPGGLLRTPSLFGYYSYN
jgi:NADPH-dependent 2,4-dienoyl-CoA reductase/sulfur reductase-like enzyme